MSSIGDFFGSLKDDLLDRRLLPFLLVLGIALVAAVGYAALGGGSATSPPSVPATPPTGSTAATGVAVSQAPASPDEAVAETTDGVSKQHRGVARDPFTPLPGAKATSSSAKSTGGSKASPAITTPSSSAGGTTPTAPKETTPAKPKAHVHYDVTVELGVVPPVAEGAPPQPAQMKTYKDLALGEPLPGKTDPQLVYRGVVAAKAGKEATFALSGGAILHGSATCKPSPTQCQTIALRVGQTETLEVLEASGNTVTYELKLLSIEQGTGAASAARARAARRRRHTYHGH